MIGRIIKQISNQYTILTHEHKRIDAIARGKLRHMEVDGASSFYQTVSSKTKKDTQHQQISPKVGDIITYEHTSDHNVITEIHPRLTDLYRPDIANVDQLFLVFSATEPEFSFILLDKFLTVLHMYDLTVHIVLTKTDLIDQKSLVSLKKQLKYYEHIGYPYLTLNIETLEDKKQILFLLKNHVSVVAGQTGVGKSTLLNGLIPQLNLATQEISKALGRGKHTTRHTELYPLNGGLIADTPGFSKLSFEQLSLEDLKTNFKEFRTYSMSCKYQSCMHLHEPLCGVKEAVQNGNILKSRYENYVSFYEEIKSTKKKY
jgi:ribosome biogenesis GTPase